MKGALNSLNKDESIVPSGSTPFGGLLANCSADALAFYNHEKVRYLILSKDRVKPEIDDNSATSKRRVRRPNNRRDFTESATYTNELTGITFEINNKQGQGLHTDIMDSAVNQLATCFHNWKRVTAIRMDLHMADQATDNTALSKLFKSINKKVKSRFPRHKNKNIGYCWVAETGIKSKKKHYHLHLYIDGNCVRTSYLIEQMVKESWQAIQHGNTVAPVTYYKHCTTMEQLKGAVYDMSYLAKSRDKGFQTKGANDYGTSRIKAISK